MNKPEMALTPRLLASPNGFHTLYSGPMELHVDAKTLPGRGRITFHLSPSVRTGFSFEGNPDVDPWGQSFANCRVVIPKKNVALDNTLVTRSGSSMNGHPRLTVEGILNGPAEVLTGPEELSYVIFHLLNFPRPGLGSRPIQDRKLQSRWLGRLCLVAEEWQVDLDGIENAADVYRDLEATQGYGITHVAKLRRTDGRLFGISDANGVLNALYHFFSLCRGIECGPQYAVGYSRHHAKIWQNWQPTRVGSWRNNQNFLWSWCYESTHNMEVLFDGFMRIWKQPTWRSEGQDIGPLVLAIHWYLASNSRAGGMEAGLIHAAIALELLSWSLMVTDRAAISPDGFTRLPLADQLRLMLDRLSIPDVIPDALVSLKKAAKTNNWDAPAAIAGIRNRIVHPKGAANNSHFYSRELRYEAWKLATELLELSLLGLLGYDGKYHSRIALNQLSVPWTK